MFSTLTLKELQDLVRVLKYHHNIVGFRRMTKEELVSKLSDRFVLLNGAIYLKNEDQKRAKSQEFEDAKTKVPQITNPELKRKINKFLKPFTFAELKNTTPAKLRKLFEKESEIDMDTHKELFKMLVNQAKSFN